MSRPANGEAAMARVVAEVVQEVQEIVGVGTGDIQADDEAERRGGVVGQPFETRNWE